MTTSKSETPDTGPRDDPNAELAALTAETASAPTGAYDPNTPPTGAYDPNTPPTGAYDPNTPPTGAYDPNTPPTGAYDPNTPPTGAYDPNTPPTGAYDPNTPPVNGNGHPPAPQPVHQQAGLWIRNRSITSLWSTSANPGVWVFVAGLGWKRLASAGDGRSSLTTLALLARNHGLPVSFHENAAGQIDQILV
ncbi:hypothetical protein GCM10017786_34980 [Amycolatopsis deserti]|uniref:Uncharacterized protein n=1 Tax=Amycolatopsis deserti TaxID=185696 RepID=A0ABQ3J2C5_9PSEU|nr:hypothetical protein [Amycolatopsis deserti]GHE98937.1 hypothetical protein GCM10017786_34980 [Amycolatopsis deserti]